jgi:hypothetical protein
VFRVAAATYSGTGMRAKQEQRAVCAAIYAKMNEPPFADIGDALRRHPVALSTFFRPLVEVLARRPHDWPYLGSLLGWWLGEAARGRRPGILRRLTARFGNRPFAGATHV